MKYDIFFSPHVFCVVRSFVGWFVRWFVRSIIPSSCVHMLIQSCITVYDCIVYTHVQFNSYSFGKIMTIYRIKWMAKKNAFRSRTLERRAHTNAQDMHTHTQTRTPITPCIPNRPPHIDTTSPTTDRVWAVSIGRKRTATRREQTSERKKNQINARKNVHLRWIQNIHTYAYHIKCTST